ncbi:MAG: hypothetical protein AVDCRST_MAG41-3970, partial [uncultured Corynebacteriales bacterium]
MQFLEGGASGPNGHIRTSSLPGEPPAGDGPRGSLMSRYRNATPPAEEQPPVPPAPRPADPGPVA